MGRRRDERQKDLFRLPLGAIFYFRHPLVLLVEKIDGGFFERRFVSGEASDPANRRRLGG